MFKTVYKVKSIKKTFNEIPTGFDNPKAKKFKLTELDTPPGTESPIVHHQGVESLDGNKNYLITGSTYDNPGYCLVIKNGKGHTLSNRKKYFDIDVAYTHPGGIQAAEHILAVGNEQYRGPTTYPDRSNIKFYDISNDRTIRQLNHLEIVRDITTGYDNEPIASAVGITKHNDQWILAVRSKNTVDFYSLIGDPNDISKKFDLIGQLDKNDYHFNDYQSIYLYFSARNKLYLFGMPRKTENDDKCFLHTIKTTVRAGKIKSVDGARTIRIRHFKRNGNGPRFKYASCIEFIPEVPSTTVGKFKITSVEANINNESIRCNSWEKKD